MSNTRKRKLKQAENRRKGKEEQLNPRNEYGMKDLTPLIAVRNLIKRERETSV